MDTSPLPTSSNNCTHKCTQQRESRARLGLGQAAAIAAVLAVCACVMYDPFELLALRDDGDVQRGVAHSCPATPAEVPADPIVMAFMSTEHEDETLSSALQFTKILDRRLQKLATLFETSRAHSKSTSVQQEVYNGLWELRRMEQPLRKAGAVNAAASDDETVNELAFEIMRARADLYSHLFNVLRQSRLLASTGLRWAVDCHPQMLADVEAFAFETAGEHQSARFDVGLYWSEIAVSTKHNPLFAKHPSESTAVDLWGARVPVAMVNAEELLLAASSANPRSHGAEVALRLREHAQVFLSVIDAVPVAAEVRYRRAAECAADASRPKLASQILARLGYFMSLRGRQVDALSAVTEALTHADDPLAGHLQAQLRVNLGELHTNDDVRSAVEKLENAAGRLPALGDLEEQRASLHGMLKFWGHVSNLGGGVGTCFSEITDMALLAICITAKLLFPTQQD